MKRIGLIVPSLVLALLAVGLLQSTIVSGQASSASAAQGIQISPALVELNALPGKTYTVTLNITNVTGLDLVYSSSVDDFNAKDESGSPQILLDSTLPETASIKTWVSSIDQFGLTTRQSKVITAQVSVPVDAEPGGHYGVIRFSGRAPEVTDTGVGLAASAGVLMLIRVDGDITENAQVSSFFTARNGDQSSFFETSPITFVTRIQNQGNIHVKPVGSIEIRDMFGGLVKTLPVNDEKSNVLPDSIRRFEAVYDSQWMIGRYTANLTLGYGTTGQALTSTINFWVIPYKIILIALLVLVTIIFILRAVLRSYKKRIIAESKK